MKPKIFTLVDSPTLGQIGNDTAITYANHCDSCGQEDTLVEFLEYSFDSWDGEDIVKTGNIYAVTDRLRNALEGTSLSGFRFSKMKTSKSEIFEDMDPDNEVSIPVFWHFKILGLASGPSGWWNYKGDCESCGRPVWEHTERVSQAVMSPLMGEVGHPRQVDFNSWHGESIFWLNDPGPPLVVQELFNLLENLQIKGLSLQIAEWVLS